MAARARAYRSEAVKLAAMLRGQMHRVNLWKKVRGWGVGVGGGASTLLACNNLLHGEPPSPCLPHACIRTQTHTRTHTHKHT
jgi:hypothetical protein